VDPSVGIVAHPEACTQVKTLGQCHPQIEIKIEKKVDVGGNQVIVRVCFRIVDHGKIAETQAHISAKCNRTEPGPGGFVETKNTERIAQNGI
jgi:hypothetical protein